MPELDNFIKEINLSFTNTVKMEDFCRVGFDINKVEPNYENTISLYDLISSFNKLYIAFKKEYEALDKLDLGEHVEVLDFKKVNHDENNYRRLVFYIDNPHICNDIDTFLYLREENTQLYSYVWDTHYREDIQLDSVKIKKYLDLFEKHQILLEKYNYLKNKKLFGNGTHMLFTEINQNLIEGLNYFKLACGCLYLNSECYIELFFRLGANFDIDYEQSKIILNYNKQEIDESFVNKLLNNTYIHKSYLKIKKK